MELIRKLSTLSAASAADGGGNAAATTANDIDADVELARQLAAEDRRSPNKNKPRYQ